MANTLYRKYRPKNFAEVIGQTHVIRTLTNAVKNDHVGHAYLFTGPRGTGKTSIARILAKTINCENIKPARNATPDRNASRSDAGGHSVAGGDALPCEKCSACEIIASGKSLDIIEIDAASNTGVDNIRELRETVALAPASLKYKVYIIDEVHMLSTGAFNALLKTLEEPPAHVVFILATTEIHKVPETILSRCQRFDFTRLPMTDIVKKLKLIADAEKVKIESEALELIAIAAEGGMRDAESLLGQIISLEDKNITVKDTEEILGTTDRKTAAAVARMITENDSTGAIAKINELLESGYDLQVFNKSLINYLRQLMLIKISSELKRYFTYEMPEEQMKDIVELAEKADLGKIIATINLLLEAQNKIASFILPQLPLEIAIIKATQKFPEASHNTQRITHNANTANAGSGVSPESYVPSKASTESPSVGSASPDLNRSTPEGISDNDNPVIIEQHTDPLPSEDNNNSKIDLYTVKSNWSQLLTDIRPHNHSLSALLSNCQPVNAQDGKVTLATPYEFYAERLRDPKNKLTVEEVLGKILGCRLILNVAVDKTIQPQKSAAAEEKPGEQESLLDSALEIMGGKVVEE
ncbi:MAG: DNA polymerase III subunit gamma/tau [Candidatus Pacebacteria bacterium]|nr:DNA polymerase III subunit gamma/tau [Candidatus Paceibacterota bacterium]MDR3583108.1 DNA polymerase III subunit gamma/tau [Candidatus Paceibacterota bacterium]